MSKNKRSKVTPKIIVFDDYPDFRPNCTKQMFSSGVLEVTYWRPIYSSITKNYKNVHLEFPKSWWENIDDKWLISTEWRFIYK